MSDNVQTEQEKPQEVEASAVNAVVRRFRVTKADVHSFTTDFTINQISEDGECLGGMSPEALIHNLGGLRDRHLEDIEGLDFTITINA